MIFVLSLTPFSTSPSYPSPEERDGTIENSHTFLNSTSTTNLYSTLIVLYFSLTPVSFIASMVK